MFKNKKGEEIDVVYSSGVGNLHVSWGINKCGFGHLNLSYDSERDTINFDSENMGREYIKAILCKMVDDGLVVDFEKALKKINPVKVEYINAMNYFGVDHNLQLPFFSKKHKNTMQLRTHGENKEVVVLYIDIKKAKERMAENYEKIKYDKKPGNRPILTKEQYLEKKFDVMGYALFARKHNVEEEFIKAQVWSWDIVHQEY